MRSCCACIYVRIHPIFPACCNIPVKIVLKEVHGADSDKDAVGVRIWEIMSYTVEDTEPGDEIKRLSPADERTVLRFLIDCANNGYAVKQVLFDPLVLNLGCFAAASLDKLVEENTSGNLADQLEVCLSKPLAREMGISMIILETKISPPEYKLCKRKLCNGGR